MKLLTMIALSIYEGHTLQQVSDRWPTDYFCSLQRTIFVTDILFKFS